MGGLKNGKSRAAKGTGKGMPKTDTTKGATIYASKKQASRPIKKQSRYEPTRYKSVNYKQY